MPENPRYAIACPTSMGVRITPEDRQGVHQSKRFLLQATSAESNVLNIASSLGHECLALTKFIEGSPISLFIQSELRARNIRYEGASVPQGGPWGYRHQFNIADSGFGLRGPRVWNDRAGEVGRTLSIGAFAAILLIMLFLPGVLALFDRWVLPRALRRQLYPPKARGAQSAKQEHKI